MADTLTHLTLNTGHIRESPRAEVGADILARLAPLVAEDGGPLPPPFSGYRLSIVRGEDEAAGSAIFTFSGARDIPLVTGLVCWRAAASADAWGQMAELMAEVGAAAGAPLPPPSGPPPRVPWLAVMLWPTIALDRRNFEVEAVVRRLDEPVDDRVALDIAVSWLGDAERCVAWALIEEEG
ncbi:MAG TPA: hypothetical protein VFL91_06415 [Thermomicrobiales bacterium]|nr:hypothetical protein [Thermomicrobiales bacterium]